MLPSMKAIAHQPFSEGIFHGYPRNKPQVKGSFSKVFPFASWVTSGAMLEVISLLTGKCLSRHHFGDDKIVGQVKDFVWEKRWCLLVELQDSSGFFYLCCYCLGTSRVVRAISLPSKVKCMEVMGDKWFKDTGHLHTTLTCFAGAAALGTDQGDILLLDLALADKKHYRTEKEAAEYKLLAGFDTGYEAELKRAQLQEIHPCVRLHIQTGACATSLAFITHTNQLVVGYSTGILQFWNLLHLHMEFQIQLESELSPIDALQFQESSSSNIPRCFLWVISSQPCRGGATIKINLLELLFREYSASAQVHYHDFLSCQVYHTQQLCDGVEPNPSVSYCRLLSCHTIRACQPNHLSSSLSQHRGIASCLDLGNLAVFTWEVKKMELATFIAVFNLSQLQEDRPEPLRSNSELENCQHLKVCSSGNRDTPVLDIVVYKNFLCHTFRQPDADMNIGNQLGLLVLNAATLFVHGFEIHGLPAYHSEDDVLEYLLTQALTNNNIRIIIRWMKKLSTEDCTVRTVLSWVQKIVDNGKKQLLTLCFNSCQGHWMYMDEKSLDLMGHVLQVLRNIVIIIGVLRHQPQCQQDQVHLDQEYRVIKQHILFAHVVHWCYLTGLLPESSDLCETARISQLWSEMQQSYTEDQQKLPWNNWKDTGLLIHGIVSHINGQYGNIWSQHDRQYDWYPPPSFQAVLKLFLIPRVDTVLVKSLFLYFLLDLTHFLHPEKEILKSFSVAFNVPHSFCQCIKGFWLLDHKNTTVAVDVLLHPGTMRPWLSWQHTWIIKALLRDGDPWAALQYINWNKPAIEKPEDLKLYITVFLHNRCVTEAWKLLIQESSEELRDGLVQLFLQSCVELGLLKELLAFTLTLDQETKQQYAVEITRMKEMCTVTQETPSPEICIQKLLCPRGYKPKPFSACLYSASSSSREALSLEGFLSLLTESVVDLQQTPSCSRQTRNAVWPDLVERQEDETQMQCLSLSTQALRQITPSPTATDLSSRFNSETSEQEEATDETHPTEKEQDKGPNCITPSISKESPEVSNGVCSLQVSLESSDSVLDSDSIFTSECIPEIEPGDDLESVNEIAEDDQKLLGCPDLLLTIDCTTSSSVLNSLDKDTQQEMIWSALEEMDSEQTCTIVCNQLATGGGATDLAMDMTQEDGERWLNVMNLHPQFYSNEDNQRTFLTCDSPVDNDIFLSSAKVQMDYKSAHGGNTRVIGEGSEDPMDTVALEEKTENVSFSQDTLSSCSCSSQSFLELEPLQRAKDFTSQEDITEGHRKEIPEVVDQPEILTSCAFTENMLRYFSDCLERKNQEDNKDENIPESKEREGLLSLSGEHFQKEKEPKQKGTAWYKTTFTSQNTSLCIPPHKTAQLKNPQLAKGNPPRVPQHIPSKAVTDRSQGGKPQKKEPICFKTTSGRLGPWKLGSWWKQALETRRASTGLLPDIEMVSSAPYAKHIPHATGRQHPHHHGIFSQSALKQSAEKSEGRQMGKEELVLKKGYCKVYIHKTGKYHGCHGFSQGKSGAKAKRP
ncbi:protein ELYS-like isoform X2 [Acipenser ruthenus]|uniref:protein ELYS-like isoform X2 n=1 Tax=Acipenser ruthenus TaxID=7906 RepID=UPI002741242F|nr:protein ELYS-like isoform X2 [Acipenser ruthenus]